MKFTKTIPVEFNHCDPAGIVFYPRYFEMTNSIIENFFADVAHYPFHRMMIEKHGVPTARLETNFRSPSRLGDKLLFTLTVRQLGRSSVDFLIVASHSSKVKMEAELTLVWVGQDGRSAPWPEEIRSRIAAFQEGDVG
jgi:4-hydroxybenzoyl-CoA thioesterase